MAAVASPWSNGLVETESPKHWDDEALASSRLTGQATEGLTMQRTRSRFNVIKSVSEVSDGVFLAREQDQEKTPEKGFAVGIASALFPFISLTKQKDSDGQYKRSKKALRGTAAFIFFAPFWLLSLSMNVYLVLAISSHPMIHSNSEGGGSAAKKLVELAPMIGHHYPWLMTMKSVFLGLVLHHLCRNVMEPVGAMFQLRYDDDEELNRPLGVVYALRSCARLLCGRKLRPRWLSSFTGDHILLFLSGSCYIIYQFNILLQSGKFHKTEGDLLGSHFAWVLKVLSSAYICILVVGFLWVTLEHNIVARKGRSKEHLALLTLVCLLWLTEFFAVRLERKFYTSPWVWADEIEGRFLSLSLRMTSGIAQVFITHSIAMLGSVVVGHACHFRKSPDLTWWMFWTRMVPCLGLAALHVAWLMARKVSHLVETCRPQLFVFASLRYEPFMTGVRFVGGLTLLILAVMHWGEQERSEEEAEEEHKRLKGKDTKNTSLRRTVCLLLMEDSDPETEEVKKTVTLPRGKEQLSVNTALSEIFDYDTVLVMGTFSTALVYDVTRVLWGYAETGPIAAAGYAAGMLAPIGLACFTVTMWQRPPVASNSSRGLWIALLLAVMMYHDFLEKEDCEITSDMPGCCDYPGLKKTQGDIRCDQPLRCRSMKPGTDMYCALPFHGGGHSNTSHCGDAHAPDTHHSDSEDGHEGDANGSLGHETRDGGSHSHGHASDSEGGDESNANGSHSGETSGGGSHSHGHASGSGGGDESDGDGSHGHETIETGSHGHGFSLSSVSDPDPTNSTAKQAEIPSDEECAILSARWVEFKLHGLEEEVEVEEHHISPAYFFLMAVGQACSVELYLTCIGVLLKVLFLTQHPRSEEILELERFHHHRDLTTGLNVVVALGPKKRLRKAKPKSYEMAERTHSMKPP